MKRIITLILALALLVSVAGCARTGTDATSSPTEEPVAEATAEPTGEPIEKPEADMTNASDRLASLVTDPSGIKKITIQDSLTGLWVATRPENIGHVCERIRSFRLSEEGITDEPRSSDDSSLKSTGLIPRWLVQLCTVTLERENGDDVFYIQKGYIQISDEREYYKIENQTGLEYGCPDYLTEDFLMFVDASDLGRRKVETDLYCTDEIQPQNEYIRTEGDTTVKLVRSAPQDETDRFRKAFTEDGWTEARYFPEDEKKVYKRETDSITISNKTPECIMAECDNIRVFAVSPFDFVMVDGVIYDAFENGGGAIRNMWLWDYDGDGAKDIVAIHTFGSGISRTSLSVFDVNTKITKSVATSYTMGDSSLFESIVGDQGVEPHLCYVDGSFYVSTKVMDNSARYIFVQ